MTRLSLHLSKCHIVGNHMSGLNYTLRASEQSDQSGRIQCIHADHSLRFAHVHFIGFVMLFGSNEP